MEVARYTIGTSIVFPRSEMVRFDAQLRILESKMRASGEKMSRFFNLRLASFNVNQTALNRALGNALDIASASLFFRVEHFVVDTDALRRALLAAQLRAQAGLPPINSRINGGPGGGAGGLGGGIYGGLSRLYGPALALGFGGYGLGKLNKINQEVVSAQLQSQAVVQQAGGTAEQGQESFSYLRQEGNRIGFNYLEASGDYNKLISGLTGSGIGLKESQKVFSGFAELARVNKLDKTTQNRLFRALSQVAGKGKLMSEELTGQIAEALPGGTALFAQAYQTKIKGNKTGSEAIQQLLADMKKGLVTSDILTYAGDKASEQANKGGALSRATQASQSQANLAQNALTDLAVVGANAGIEEGFARIFRTLTAGLSESNGLVRTFAEGFNEATKWAEDLLLFPQSFVRALEGRDSLVADWLGIDKSSQLVKDWQTIKEMFNSISLIKFDFLPTLEATAREIAQIMGKIAEFQQWINQTKGSTDQPLVNGFIQPITWGYQVATKTYAGFNEATDRAQERGRRVYENPTDTFYQNPKLYDDYFGSENQKNMAMDQAAEGNDWKLNGSGSVTNQFDISINIDPATMGNIDVQSQAEDLMNRFKIELSNASVNFPVKE